MLVESSSAYKSYSERTISSLICLASPGLKTSICYQRESLCSQHLSLTMTSILMRRPNVVEVPKKIHGGSLRNQHPVLRKNEVSLNRSLL